MANPKKRAEPKPYLVIRDTREQQGWTFPKGAVCLGTEEATLHTGDYTLKGYESVLVVERKRNAGEIATNLVQARFEREMERMEAFPLAFLVCEFTLSEIINFPEGSGVPRWKWPTLRVTPQFILKRLNELQLRYRTRLIFAGRYGREFCSSLFKRVTENADLQASN